MLEKRSCFFRQLLLEVRSFLLRDVWALTGFRVSIEEDARCPRTVVAIMRDEEKTFLRKKNNVFCACEQRVKTREWFGHHMSSIWSRNTK